MLEIACQAETLVLLADKAVWWPATRTLIVADVHFGKAAAFRAGGVPVPAGTTRTDLARLSALVENTAARRIVFLGDLLHARAGRAAATLEAIGQWRAAHADVEMALVRGNHDRGAGDPPKAWGMRCVSRALIEGPFAFQHEPKPHRRGYVLSGHLHPSVTLGGRAGGRLRAACYWFGKEVAVLPAFGRFTGLATVRPAPRDRVYAVGEGAVVCVAGEEPAAGHA